MQFVPCLAYIDPVSGTILLQLIVAGFVGCVAFFRRTIWRVCNKILRLDRNQPQEGSDSG